MVGSSLSLTEVAADKNSTILFPARVAQAPQACRLLVQESWLSAIPKGMFNE